MKTEKEIAQLVADYKSKGVKTSTITCFLDEDDQTKTATIIVRRPTKDTRSIIGALLQKDISRAVEAALKNVYLGGDYLNLIVNNDYALASCEDAVAEMLVVSKAILKKN